MRMNVTRDGIWNIPRSLTETGRRRERPRAWNGSGDSHSADVARSFPILLPDWPAVFELWALFLLS